MSAWADLDAELDRWAEAGRTARFWWRDDDAHAAGPALARLVALAAESGTPLALAVIPALVGDDVVGALDGAAVTVLQHGYAHLDTAPPGAKKTELDVYRPLALTVGDLGQGRARLEALFGRRALPVLVPPWNRIAPVVVPLLPEIGFRGLSRYRARTRPRPVAGLVEVNAHVDIVDWKAPGSQARAGVRPFAGEAACLGLAVAHLAARRTGTADGDEPTGLLTHHRAHDEAAWTFAARFIERVARHPAAAWVAPAELFPA